jgi:hypothetical protein
MPPTTRLPAVPSVSLPDRIALMAVLEQERWSPLRRLAASALVTWALGWLLLPLIHSPLAGALCALPFTLVVVACAPGALFCLVYREAPLRTRVSTLGVLTLANRLAEPTRLALTSLRDAYGDRLLRVHHLKQLLLLAPPLCPPPAPDLYAGTRQ